MSTTTLPVGRVHAAKGAVLTGMAQVYRIGLTFVSGVLLARLLTPGDFGLVAMVSVCVAFVSLIQDLGLNHTTVQRERISQAQSSALFWLSTGFSLVMALGLAGCAPLIAWFFGDSRLIALTMAFALLVALGGCQSQHFALLNRELRFKALAGIDLLRVTVSTVVGVSLAWLTASYWALFVTSLASTLVGLVCVWIVCKFRPGRPSFEGDFKEIVGFASSVSGFNLVNYFSRNADSLLIGRFYGAEQLGFYDRANRLLLFPLSQIQAPLMRVMFPVLSRLRSEPARYRNAYGECVTLLLIAIHPGLLFVIVFPETVFTMLLGHQWAPAADIFRWLGVAGLHQVMTSSLGWLFLSQGRGGDFFKLGVWSSITTVTSFVVGLPWGPVGVAVAYTISDYAVRLPLAWACTGRCGPVSARDLVAIGLPHLIATVATSLTLIGVANTLRGIELGTYLLLIALSYLSYLVVIALFPTKRRIILANLNMFVTTVLRGRVPWSTVK